MEKQLGNLGYMQTDTYTYTSEIHGPLRVCNSGFKVTFRVQGLGFRVILGL